MSRYIKPPRAVEPSPPPPPPPFAGRDALEMPNDVDSGLMSLTHGTHRVGESGQRPFPASNCLCELLSSDVAEPCSRTFLKDAKWMHSLAHYDAVCLCITFVLHSTVYLILLFNLWRRIDISRMNRTITYLFPHSATFIGAKGWK